jgi:uncharacterized protein (DUF1015 family)
MADVRPFKGLRYNPSAVGDLSKVLCPPYDIISRSDEEMLLQRSPYNAVRLELREEKPGEPRDEGRYGRAAAFFQQCLNEGVLVPERSPAMYLVEETFSHNGATMRRHGLMAAVRLEEFEKGIILPHEHTRPGPKADRLALMRACHTNFSPIMCLYRDADGAIVGAKGLSPLLAQASKGRPTVSAAPDGQPSYRMWVIADRGILSRITDAMASRQIFIADGHHRYETALQYRNELEASEGPLSPNAASRFMMMTLISMEDPGLLVLPYHRLAGGLSRDELASLRRGLGQAFEMAAIQVPRGSAKAVAKSLEGHLRQQPKDKMVAAAFGLEPGAAHLLTLRDAYRPGPDRPSLEKSDMWLLHQHGIRPALGEEREGAALSFVHDAAEAIESVSSGASQVAFLLRPLPMELFEEVVGRGQRLPSKSTYFYPKLPTGLVINHLAGEL